MTTEQRILCVICSNPERPRRATPGYITCDRCADRIRDTLAELPGLYATLTKDEALLPVGDPGGRRGPGFGSRSPANDQAIALTDKRTTWTEEDRIDNPLVVVESWARMVREDVGEEPPYGGATMYGEAQFLIRRLDFITRQPWVDEFWEELRRIRYQLGRFNGESPPVSIGKCKTLLEDKECGTPLFAPPQGDTIRCSNPKCRREWTRAQWAHLGRTLRVLASESEGGTAA